MKRLNGQTVVLTGAAKGLGACLAQRLAEEGCRLVLCDVDAASLEKVAATLKSMKVEVSTHVVDVSRRESVEELAHLVMRDIGVPDVLINNAGIGHMGELATTDLETWKRLLAVNFWGPLYHIYAFLPGMMARKSGHIVNISSGQAFFRLPSWGAYASIKAALGAFSEILRFELRRHGIRVTTIYPFMINTGFYQGIEGQTFLAKLSMKLVPFYSMEADTVARIAVKAIKRERGVELVSVINQIGFYSHLVPPLADAMGILTGILLTKGSSERAPSAANAAGGAK